MKICKKCEIKKEFTEFYYRKSTKDKLYTICKECVKQERKEFQVKNEEKYNNYQKKYREENELKIKQQRKKYLEENKVAINKKQKELREQNKEKFKKDRREYIKENKEKIRKQQREYRKEKYKNDPVFRLERCLRSATRRVIKYGCKSASTQELLGCTWEEAIVYLEKQFLEGMTWENHGEWEIDHIRPMASFDLTDLEQQKLCCHYTNLQPLWTEDNLKKSSIYNDVKYYYKEKGR